jgi:dienelactone hydrolase
LLIWLGLSHQFRKVSLECAHDPVCAQIAREEVLAALAEHVYGPELAPIAPRVLQREAIAPHRAGGVEGVEQWLVDLGEAGQFYLVLVLPERRPAPLILMQSFCGNQAAFPGRPAAIAAPLRWHPWICREPRFDPLLRATFGEHIGVPPYDMIRDSGYALAIFYGGDVVPDDPRTARRVMSTFAPPEAGALSVWAWAHSRALDVLAQDERIDASRVALWGQSRQGKVALLAGARDARFAAVAALQSGRGGDAPTRHRAGESVAAINLQFPHWFAPRFREYARRDPPVDQQDVLALIAPRPLLIGHAWNDGWADPAGASAAVKAATPAWTRAGAEAPLFFVREGRHGIVRRDWEETLAFLDARMR